jgi:hypothetical protein
MEVLFAGKFMELQLDLKKTMAMIPGRYPKCFFRKSESRVITYSHSQKNKNAKTLVQTRQLFKQSSEAA